MNEYSKDHRRVVIFHDDDLPQMASHCAQTKCGYSLYRGVLVVWDEDHDLRVLSLLDSMLAIHLADLLVVQEHEGCVSFLWNGRVPSCYAEDRQIDSSWIDDVWNIGSSVVCRDRVCDEPPCD